MNETGNIAEPTAATTGASTNTGSSRKALGSISSQGRNAIPSTTTSNTAPTTSFQIYEEGADTDAKKPSALLPGTRKTSIQVDENSNWKSFGSESIRTKENDGKSSAAYFHLGVT